MRCLPSIVLAGSILAASAAVAQDRLRAGEQKPSSPSRSWVRLCETPTAGSKDLLGKPNAAGVKTCLILHEQLDATTGALRVAAGVQQADGRQTLMIRVTPDVSRERGVSLTILPRDIWQIIDRNPPPPLTQSQLSQVRRLTLAYSLCDAEGCLAETEATPKLVVDLKSGGGLMVVTLKGKHAFAYRISLGGFREVYDGPPIDAARFRQAREDLLRGLRERQKGWAPPPLPPPSPPRGKGDQPQPPPVPPGKGDQRI